MRGAVRAEVLPDTEQIQSLAQRQWLKIPSSDRAVQRGGMSAMGSSAWPNQGLQATANSVRSCLAPALRRA